MIPYRTDTWKRKPTNWIVCRAQLITNRTRLISTFLTKIEKLNFIFHGVLCSIAACWLLQEGQSSDWLTGKKINGKFCLRIMVLPSQSKQLCKLVVIGEFAWTREHFNEYESPPLCKIMKPNSNVLWSCDVAKCTFTLIYSYLVKYGQLKSVVVGISIDLHLHFSHIDVCVFGWRAAFQLLMNNE